jgi:hypothetical protein
MSLSERQLGYTCLEQLTRQLSAAGEVEKSEVLCEQVTAREDLDTPLPRSCR